MKVYVLAFALAVAVMVHTATANTCGGNCPSNDCPSCPCGTSRNYVSASEWCAKFSKWDQAMCQCIMSHESSGNSNAANYNTNASFDVGAWQINSINWASCSGGKPPCDMQTNLECAIKVWGWGGNSFRLWSTYAGCAGVDADAEPAAAAAVAE